MNSPEILEPEALYFNNHGENGNSSSNSEFKNKITIKIEEMTIRKHFLRMSAVRKMDLITKMFMDIRNVRSMTLILNIFFPVHTKLMFYSKVTNDSNSLYEQFVQDHDRMLDTEVLNECISEDLQWFRTLSNRDQINVIVDLLRLSGGNVIKKMYWRLIKIFNDRVLNQRQCFEKYTSRTSMNFPEDGNRRTVTVEDYRLSYSGEDEISLDTESSINENLLHVHFIST